MMLDPFGKLTLFGVAASAAVMAVGSDGVQAAAKDAPARMQQVSMVRPRAVEPVKPLAAAESLEFERMLQRKRQPAGDGEIGNAFSATSWYVPPPPPPALPPPPPSAPPLPFSYLGQYKDAASGATVIFLSNGDRVYTVSEGDVIDGTYSVGPIASGQLELTYLPLKIKQSLNTGGA
jgi:hypothetical protein